MNVISIDVILPFAGLAILLAVFLVAYLFDRWEEAQVSAEYSKPYDDEAMQ
jgi:hypothetical protein